MERMYIDLYDSQDIFVNGLQQFLPKDKDIVFVCIGSMKSHADSIGPRIGSMLQELKIKNPIYGTWYLPIHAQNIFMHENMIKQSHPDAFIIGIDACIGKSENVGKIILNPEPLKPGSGVGKTLPTIGDMAICCTITDDNLLHSSFSLVDDFVRYVPKYIYETLQTLKREEKETYTFLRKYSS